MDSEMQAEAKKIYWSICSSFLHRLLFSPPSQLFCFVEKALETRLLHAKQARSNTIFKLSQGSCNFSQKSINIAGLFGMRVYIDCADFWIIDTEKVSSIRISSNRDLMIRQQHDHENLAEK